MYTVFKHNITDCSIREFFLVTCTDPVGKYSGKIGLHGITRTSNVNGITEAPNQPTKED